MKLLVTLGLVFSVLSCSSGGNKVEVAIYQKSVSSPSLEIPPDLTALDDSFNKSIPGSIVGTRKAIGWLNESSSPMLDSVLPKISGVVLKGEGDFFWLEVSENPTKVYDLLKTFWSEEGFLLEQDEPLIGIMKTEWLENKVGILSKENSFLGNLLSGLYSNDTKDQYKTRVARSSSDETTHVYLTQYGREFMLIEDTLSVKQSGWQSRAKDIEVEVEMLSRMMLFLGLQDDQVKEQLAKLGEFPKRAKITTDDNDIPLLVVKESLDRAWNRVIVQLDRLNVEYISKDKDNQLISIKQKVDEKSKETGFLSSLFSSDKQEDKENFIIMNISFEESNDTTLVDIVTDSGGHDDSESGKGLFQYLFITLK